MEWKQNCQLWKKQEDDERKRLLEELQGDDDDDGDVGLVDEVQDFEEIFLQQFPYLAVHYKNNKRKIDKMGKVKGWSIMAGGWILPTCCSMLINFL